MIDCLFWQLLFCYKSNRLMANGLIGLHINTKIFVETSIWKVKNKGIKVNPQDLVKAIPGEEVDPQDWCFQAVKKLNFKIEPNTFILIKEPNLKKFQYKTGRVLSTIRSKDGLIRTLEIQTTQNKKPIFRDIKLCSLLEHTYLKLAEDNHECFFTHKSCLLSNEWRNLCQ